VFPQKIKTKRVYEPPEPDDGLRILVDRVWPRGLSRQRVAADLWLRDIAPSDALRKWFGHRPERWQEFVQRYHRELDARPELVSELEDYLARGPVTLLYSARDPGMNQAVALVEYLRTRRRTHGTEPRQARSGQPPTVLANGQSLELAGPPEEGTRRISAHGRPQRPGRLSK